MLIKKTSDITGSDITDYNTYLERRQFLRGASTSALAAGVAGIMSGLFLPGTPAHAGEKLEGVHKSPLSTDEALTPYKDVTQYNNFYEFGTDKSDPAKLAKDFRSTPWSVAVEGEINKPATYHLEDLLRPSTLEERIYRLRCVEGWSMVIPWVGVPKVITSTRSVLNHMPWRITGFIVTLPS